MKAIIQHRKRRSVTKSFTTIREIAKLLHLAESELYRLAGRKVSPKHLPSRNPR